MEGNNFDLENFNKHCCGMSKQQKKERDLNYLKGLALNNPKI